jgi:hypothetical protein
MVRNEILIVLIIYNLLKKKDSIQKTTEIENKKKFKSTTIKIQNKEDLKTTQSIIHEASRIIDKTKNLIPDSNKGKEVMFYFEHVLYDIFYYVF